MRVAGGDGVGGHRRCSVFSAAGTCAHYGRAVDYANGLACARGGRDN